MDCVSCASHTVGCANCATRGRHCDSDHDPVPRFSGEWDSRPKRLILYFSYLIYATTECQSHVRRDLRCKPANTPVMRCWIENERFVFETLHVIYPLSFILPQRVLSFPVDSTAMTFDDTL